MSVDIHINNRAQIISTSRGCKVMANDALTDLRYCFVKIPSRLLKIHKRWLLVTLKMVC